MPVYISTKTRTLYLSERTWSKGDSDTGYPFPVLKAVNLKFTRTRTGAALEHWKDRIRQHLPATTQLDGVYNSIESIPGYQTTRFRWDPVVGYAGGRTERTHTHAGEISAYISSEPTPNFTWNSAADSRARNRFLSEVRSAQTSIQSGVFLKELKQTVNLLRRPAEAFWKLNNQYYSALYQRKRRVGPRKWWKDLPSIWLEYSFGWRPLMMDIDDAWGALNRLLEREYVMRVMGNGSDSKNLSETNGNYQPSAPIATKIQFRYNSRKWEKDTVRYLGGVLVRATTTFSDKAAVWGFNPEEFLPSAWEILPWSFLIDYFVSIGDYLDATFANTATVVWAQSTRRQLTLVSRVDIPDTDGVKNLLPASSYVHSVGSPSWARWKRAVVTRREVAPGSIQPALYVKWNGPNFGQFANIYALLGQASSNLELQHVSRRSFRIHGAR